MLVAQGSNIADLTGTLFTFNTVFPRKSRLQSVNVVLKGTGKAEVILEQSTNGGGAYTLVKTFYLPTEGMALAENLSGTSIEPTTADTASTRILRARFIKSVGNDVLECAMDYYVD